MDNRRLMGKMTLSAEQAGKVGAMLDLPAEAVEVLQVVPDKGSLPTAVPTDPLIYRFYELVNVYGTSIKELIHEEFGDGIMSAIDFSMDITREPNPKCDRVHIVMSGKFLPYVLNRRRPGGSRTLAERAAAWRPRRAGISPACVRRCATVRARSPSPSRPDRRGTGPRYRFPAPATG